MISENLYDLILLNPCIQGGNRLYIVSGYATSAMAFHHLETLVKRNSSVQVKLIVGMGVEEGISISSHRGFQKIMNEDFNYNFECNYISSPPPVHSKLYAWFQDNNPLAGFIGSANYTQTAFGLASPRREIMSDCDPQKILDYFNGIVRDSIYCNHPDAENAIRIFNDRYRGRKEAVARREEIVPEKSLPSQEVADLPFMRTSLLDNI